MNINIRNADEKDFPVVMDLIREFAVFQNAADKVSITLEKMIEWKSLFHCFLAECDREIVGFASCFFAYYSWSGKALYLDDLYVKQTFRKMGIGKQLLQSVIKQAQEAKCVKVRWQVSKWNQNAIDFYKSIGASIDEVEINCDISLLEK